MANPTWVVERNVHYNGTLTNVMPLTETTGIIWDNLSAEDQSLLTTFGDRVIATVTPELTNANIYGIQQVLFNDGIVVGANNFDLPYGSDASGYAVLDFGGSIVADTDACDLSHIVRDLHATITIDGTKHVTLTIPKVNTVLTFANLLTSINTQLDGDATATLVDGNIRITSATTGELSTVQVMDTGWLFYNCPGYVGIGEFVAGDSEKTFVFSVEVDGTVYNVTIPSTVATYEDFKTAAETVFDGAATVNLGITNITIISSSSGADSRVRILQSPFALIPEFIRIAEPADGFDSVIDTFNNWVLPTGVLAPFAFPVVKFGGYPTIPTNCPLSIDYIYFGGTQTDDVYGNCWRYLADGTVINSDIILG